MASGKLQIKVRLKHWDASSEYARQLLRGPVAQSLVRDAGERVLARASSMYGAKNYGLEVKVGSKRVRAYVYTADRHAMRSNLVHNTLAKSVK